MGTDNRPLAAVGNNARYLAFAAYGRIVRTSAAEINPSVRACRDFSCGGYARHAPCSHVGRDPVR